MIFSFSLRNFMKICAKCKLSKQLEEFGQNRRTKDGKNCYCKPCAIIQCKESRSNPEVRKRGNERTSRYYQKNKDKRNAYNLERHHKRMATDPLYVLKKRYRNRTRKLFRYINRTKEQSSIPYLGCDFSFFKEYFESKFTEGMSWEKVLTGEIHIDHIVPISTAKDEEDIKRLSHYSNLQPLWAIDNLKKANKV